MKTNKKIIACIKKTILINNEIIRLKPVGNLTKVAKSFFFVDRIKEKFAKIENNIHSSSEEAEIREVEQEVASANSKKSTKWSWIFLCLNLVVVAAIFIVQAVKGGMKPLSELFAMGPYYRFLFIACGFFLLTVLLETLKIILLMYKATRQVQPVLAYKVSAIGKYWDCITPLGTGGQPFQIYCLNKNGYRGEIATGIPIAKYIFWQIAFIIISLAIILSPANQLATQSVGSSVVYGLAWFGLICNIVLFIFSMTMSINRNFGEKIVVFGLKILTKLHIIRNYEKTLKKVIKFVDKYQRCMKLFASSPLTVITQVLLAGLSIFTNVSIAYFIYLAFNFPVVPFDINTWLQIASMAVICDLAVSFVPLPGGSAAAEVSFVALFSGLFAEGTVFWALLFWRALTYYIYIVQGLCITFIEFLIKKKHTPPKTVSDNITIEEEK